MELQLSFTSNAAYIMVVGLWLSCCLLLSTLLLQAEGLNSSSKHHLLCNPLLQYLHTTEGNSPSNWWLVNPAKTITHNNNNRVYTQFGTYTQQGNKIAWTPLQNQEEEAQKACETLYSKEVNYVIPEYSLNPVAISHETITAHLNEVNISAPVSSPSQLAATGVRVIDGVLYKAGEAIPTTTISRVGGNMPLPKGLNEVPPENRAIIRRINAPHTATTLAAPTTISRIVPNSSTAAYEKVLLADVYDEEIPCYAHYGYAWSSSDIHPYRYDLAQMPQTVEFLLTYGLSNDFSMPIDGFAHMTSNFGPRWGRHHNGIDLDLDTGDTVRTTFKGKVRFAGRGGGYGNLVIVRHYNGLETFYAHLSKVLVKPGQDIEPGKAIGLGGSTGHSTGSHLHYEVRYKGHPIDPNEMVDFRSHRLKSHTFVIDKSYFSSSNPYASAHGGKKSKSNSKYHTVRRGDTLSGISSKYGTSVKKLCALNKINTKSTIKTGQKLRLR